MKRIECVRCFENLFCFGKVLQEIVSFGNEPDKPWTQNTDDMAVVSDVHTDSNTETCLEEGVGYPLEIYVIVNEGGKIRLTRGAMFSYYEFTRPIAQRLTDEAWRTLLLGDTPPQLPEWIASFFKTYRDVLEKIELSPDNLYDKPFTGISDEPTEILPDHLALHPNFPNPFNPETIIRFDLPRSTPVRLSVFNLMGVCVRILKDQPCSAGMHTVVWDGKNDSGSPCPSGLYIARLQTGGSVKTQRMVLIR